MKILKFAVSGLLFLFITIMATAQTRPGSLRGIVKDAVTGETIPFANIVLRDSSGLVIGGASSDLDGRYSINPIMPGLYRAEASFTGYASVIVKGIMIVPNSPSYQDFALNEESEMLSEVVIEYEAPLIEKSRSSSITAADEMRISGMAVRDVTSVASPNAGVLSTTGYRKNIRGCRSEGTVYFIDGVKVRGSVNIPQAAVAQSPVQLSGTPASIGDHKNPLNDYEILFLTPQQVQCITRSPKKVKEPKKHHAGILTAGELNDFSKWNLWEDFNETNFDTWKKHWEVNPIDRYTVQISFQNGIPVIDAVVRLLDKSSQSIFRSRTDNTGKAELWNNIFRSGQEVGSIIVELNGKSYEIKDPSTFEHGINTLEIEEDCQVPDHIDICFVVDATGSMTDEINYLKAELEDVISRVSHTLSNTNIRLANVFYRDHGDNYVTRHFDFSKDIKKGMNFIRSQTAGGGGDYPEAVIEALQVGVNEISWSEQAVTRIMFLVLDAPPHHDSGKVDEIQNLISKAAEKGIRIIPIASSGIDKSTEYILRSFALATNGTYTFLTDDSGVGNPHLKPTTDSYKVELLNDLMVRLIHQFAFTPECIERQPDPELLASTDSLNKTEIISGEIVANDSSSLADINPKDINNILRQGYGKRINWHYYPNPTRDVVNIEFNRKVNEVYLTDLRGKILIRKVVDGKGLIQISLEAYPVGTYFIKFHHDKQWITERVIRIN